MAAGSDDFLAVAFKFAPLGLIYTECRIIKRANEAFAAMFGLDCGVIHELPLGPFYPSIADFESIGARAQKVLYGTGLYSDERTMIRRNGELFWCAVTGRSLTPANPLAQVVWCFQDMSRQWKTSDLSPRDREIAILTCEGRRAKEIARLLDLSPRTVEAYLARLKHKLNVRNVAELVARLRADGEPVPTA